MVAILEEVKISIKEDYLLHYINVYGEKTHDYISKNEFFFKKGRYMELYVSKVQVGKEYLIY